ncbi:MAG: UDP-N-acetylmuramate--L-alanine ligase [Spirochaetaceae bacterium]|jgi:UDP-N-acetylmuramate--alanine ligase|nr:UDP-N-acetylmuramate--L-alanine ligase [Spirochaetaceae bacterium]
MDIKKMFGPGAKVYFIGIKGTGMCALAELLVNSGVRVSGSDRDEVFYTDGILKELGVPYYESFAPEHIPDGTDLVVYSAAYSFDTNSEMAEARNRGIPLLKYTDALGAYSAGFDSSGVAGVHGKTTTTALAGAMIRGVGLPARVLAGSVVSAFGGHSTLNGGSKYFVAETCEYRKHFLSFHPRRIILTSVEGDHQDFYPTYESIRDAFVEYVRLLPPGGELIYCADDPGAREVAEIIAGEGRGVVPVPYGFTAPGDFGIDSFQVSAERLRMKVRCFPGELRLRLPGRHSALDATAALALVDSLVKNEGGWTGEKREKLRAALEDVRGSRRRSEIVGEYEGILFMDDYGHHPTALRTTLEGLKEFYPGRRLVVSFMSHTYTRTASLLEEFAASLEKADLVFLHKIYASARESYRGGVTGRTLFEKTRALREGVYYADEPEDAMETLKDLLKAGDLFITLGAGDNWKLGKALADYFAGKKP